MRLNDGFHEREPEAAPLRRGRLRLCPFREETIEHPRQVFGRDAWSRVRNLEKDARGASGERFTSDRDFDASIISRERRSVVDQIAHDRVEARSNTRDDCSLAS